MLAHRQRVPAPRRRPGSSGSSSGRGRGALLVLGAIKAKSVRQIACSKTLVARPDAVEQVKQLCQDVTAFSQQTMASDRASGIREFSCVVDGWEDNVIHFWERYDSNVALGRHNTRPEVEAFMKAVVPLLEKPVGMVLYEYRDGKIGAVCIQSGPKGEGGLDDATGASGAAGGASYKQTSAAAQLTSVVEDEDLFGSSSGGSSSSSSSSGSSSGAAGGAWWSFAGSQPAAVAALVGAAAVLAVVGWKLSGH